MLAFITSVRHPRNSTDYGRVEGLLRRTLASVCRQTVDDYVVLVACNRVPEGDFGSRVEFVPVDFPPPTDFDGPRTGREAVLLDKGTKLAAALVAAQRHSPDFVMKFDADDFVSRRLAALASSAPGNGWYVEDGFVVSASTGLITPCPAFNTRCGTSELVANRLYDLPQELPAPDASQEELIDALGTFLVRELLGSHRRSVEHFAGLGSPLAPVPFPAAVYTIATGENHSGRDWMARGRPVSRSQAEEFGIEHLRTPRAWSRLARQEAGALAQKVRSAASR